jgi:hypothetical protein
MRAAMATTSGTTGNRIGTVTLVAALLGLLAASIWFAVHSWMSVEGPPMPTSGYVAMTLGVVFSIVVGSGLMALIFYSSRHGYDEPSYEETRHEETRHEELRHAHDTHDETERGPAPR